MENPDVFQGHFLFVNKNATNVKSRSPDEAFTVGSHVCGRYARWRKVARVKPRRIVHSVQSRGTRILHNSNDVNGEKEHVANVTVEKLTVAKNDGKRPTLAWSRAIHAPVSSVPKSATRRASNDSTSGTGEGAEAAQSSTRYPGNSAHATTFRLTEAHPKQRPEISKRTLWPSPRTILGKGNSDPFSSAVFPISPSMSSLINVWQGVYLETVWPVDASTASRAPALLSWQNDCRDAIANEARLHALLTWTLMLQISSLSGSSYRSKLLLQYFGHKNKCLESLRKELTQGASYLNMVPVLWHLTGAEFYAGDVSTATIHFAALKAMVESCGGLRALPWAMKTLVVVADMTLSQVKMEPLLFSVDQWDPGSISPKLSHAEAEVLALNPHFTGNSHYELPESVIDIFRDYRELLAVYELVDGIPDGSRRTQLLCWAQLRQYALNSRVTQRRIDIAAAPLATGNRASELCTCVAVDYFQQLIWQTRHKARSQHVPFHHPRPSFDDLLPNPDLVGHHLTLWIYFLAATVEQIDCYHGRRKETGHSHRFFALMKRLDLRSAQDLRCTFKYFLYCGENLDRYLHALLARAEQLPYDTET